jgi:plastocyanin
MRHLCVWLLALLVTGRASPEIDIQGTAILNDKPVADAVVWVEAPGMPRASRSKAVLDQRNLNFYPRVLVVQVGTTVEFPNHDRVFHDVFSFRDGKQFELGLYPVGAVKQVPFDRPGLSRVFCNIHPGMAAYIMVVDSPYFAVTDRGGRFTLSRMPAGTFTYHAWRPGGAILTASATIRAGTVLEVQWR